MSSYLFGRRFNLFDIFYTSCAAQMLGDGRIFIAFAVLGIGTLISVIGEEMRGQQ